MHTAAVLCPVLNMFVTVSKMRDSNITIVYSCILCIFVSSCAFLLLTEEETMHKSIPHDKSAS